MERLLVTGVDGCAGANLALALSDRCHVLGLHTRHAVACDAFETTSCDPATAQQLEGLIGEWRPTWLIHCGPLCASWWDSTECLGADEAVNAGRLAQLALEHKFRLTVLSSDSVFAGPRMFHTEESEPTNASARAAHTLALEGALDSRTLVVRTHVYGWSPTGSPVAAAEAMAESLLGGMTVSASGLSHATPILATDLAELLWRAFETRLEGLYHMGGAERTSQHRFACELAASLGVNVSQVRVEPTEPAWPDETSMNSRRARRALECPLPLLCEGITRFTAQATNGWRGNWRVAGEHAYQQAAA
ncbi:MAG TPA: sugar nucleotide-binding protein [Pirellulales bacterium]|jgi:dTDP-4-dehydrorhamnose reductase